MASLRDVEGVRRGRKGGRESARPNADPASMVIMIMSTIGMSLISTSKFRVGWESELSGRKGGRKRARPKADPECTNRDDDTHIIFRS